MGVIVGGAAFSPISIPSKVNLTCNSSPCLKIGRSKGRNVVSKFSGGNGHIDLSGEQLKSQLESLQREADQSRQKANSTRARFMRLTEAVDKLQLQALSNVKAGKESAAREMLLQKRKVMQALENSKRRAELLDELLKKLGEMPTYECRRCFWKESRIKGANLLELLKDWRKLLGHSNGIRVQRDFLFLLTEGCHTNSRSNFGISRTSRKHLENISQRMEYS